MQEILKEAAAETEKMIKENKKSQETKEPADADLEDADPADPADLEDVGGVAGVAADLDFAKDVGKDPEDGGPEDVGDDVAPDEADAGPNEINLLGRQLEANVQHKIDTAEPNPDVSDSSFSKSIKNSHSKSRSSKSSGNTTHKRKISKQKTKKYKRLLLKLDNLQKLIKKALLDEEEKLNNLSPDPVI